MNEKLVIIRGGGDLATGVVQSLYEAGFRLLVLELDRPSAIRRQVALSEAVYDGEYTVENVTCRRCLDLKEIEQAWSDGVVPLVIDPKGCWIEKLKPWAVVDAILAKKNIGTTRTMAPHTVALGPGFTAGVDVDIVVETKRGHRLGRLIREGMAEPNTGVPGLIAGFGRERVLHSPCAGYLYGLTAIGDHVEKGQVMAVITKAPLPPGTIPQAGDGTPVIASLTGFVRGLVRTGYAVPKGFKIADIDPREGERANCFTISDKARNLGGAVLTALLWLERENPA